MPSTEWKQSDRTTCPKCGSTNYQNLGKWEAVFAGVGGMIMINIFLIVLGLILPFLWFLLIITVPMALLSPIAFLIGKKKMRKCLDCKKVWEYFREPDKPDQAQKA